MEMGNQLPAFSSFYMQDFATVKCDFQGTFSSKYKNTFDCLRDLLQFKPPPRKITRARHCRGWYPSKHPTKLKKRCTALSKRNMQNHEFVTSTSSSVSYFGNLTSKCSNLGLIFSHTR
ncbi:Uncharacterized protein TCM_034721 [Theobroma cacao]|uniref:Uncharacterized protein n=1 Tax=Theobroma cacao TaxID=3641 RepID=A0A061FFD3_THECC|nr:Uncharacterized protein TCM_034721 [Theobroma cacao]